MVVMDIVDGCGYPASELSNFTPHKFIIDTIECESMEGFLQSLKFQDLEKQKSICLLTGKAAKFAGKKSKWWKDQKLFWCGNTIERDSLEYQIILDRAFGEMLAQNENFRLALVASGNAIIKHSMGKSDKTRTVLTEEELCSRLMALRLSCNQQNSTDIQNDNH